MSQRTLTVIHVVELFVDNDGNAVVQIKLQNKQSVTVALGTSVSQETYYRKVTNPSVVVGQEVTIELDNYDVVVEEFEVEDEKIIKLKYLYNKR